MGGRLICGCGFANFHQLTSHWSVKLAYNASKPILSRIGQQHATAVFCLTEVQVWGYVIGHVGLPLITLSLLVTDHLSAVEPLQNAC